MKKAEQEKLFVEELLKIGVKNYAEMYERGNSYYCFFMNDGNQRFWTNISKENLERLLDSDNLIEN